MFDRHTAFSYFKAWFINQGLPEQRPAKLSKKKIMKLLSFK